MIVKHTCTRDMTVDVVTTYEDNQYGKHDYMVNVCLKLFLHDKLDNDLY